jgi:hypothetical protein
MNITQIVNEVEKCVKTHGYNLWFGAKGTYEGKRYTGDREAILEPFEMKVQREGSCYYDTNFTIWLATSREIDTEFTSQQTGAKTDYMDYMLKEASSIIDTISDNSMFLMHKKKHEIPVKYHEASSNVSSNSQAFVTFTLPIRVYGTD